jgi:hypothetical protein
VAKQKYSDDELEAIVEREIAASVTYDSTVLAKKRQSAVEYIQGTLTAWPAEEGRSSITDMTLMETHSWMLPQIVRTFVASDNMAIAEPSKKQDEPWANQATVGINFTFWKANDGYQTLYDVTYDSLLHGDGYVKHWFDDTPDTKVSFHSGLSDDELSALLEPEDDGTDDDGNPLEEIEIIDHTTEEYTLDPGDEGYEDYPPAGLMGQGGMPQQQQPMPGPQMPGGPPGMPGEAPQMPAPPPFAPEGAPPMDGSAGEPGGMAGEPSMPPAPPSLSQPIQQSPMPPMGGPMPPMGPEGPAVIPPDMSADMSMGGGAGPPVPPQPRTELRHSVKIKRTCRYGQVRLAAIAPEDMVVSGETTDLRKSRLVGCKETKTRSELLEMGFDKDKVDQLVADTDDDAIKLSRQAEQGEIVSIGVATTEMELIVLYELYLRIDMDGDGISEVVQIFFGGYGGVGQLLEWNLWEDEPVFTNVPSYRVPHRLNANSLHDRTKDIQEIKTVLERQGLDSLYGATTPQKVAVGRCLNPDELTNPSFGGTILMEEGGSVSNLQQEFVGAVAFQGIEFFNGIVEKRTGISRQTMALDPEALQNQTATASQLAHDAGYTQTELVTRNMAQLGWVFVFRSILKLMVRHQQRRSTVRLTGKKWVEIDPRHWNADMDITINTGLGTGSRDRDMGTLQAMRADQVAMLAIFREAQMPDKALQMVPMMLSTLRKSAEAAGIRNVDDYYPEVTEADLMQAKQAIEKKNAQPPPEMMQAQMMMQVEQGKIQATSQAKQAEIQANAAAENAKVMAKMQADRQTSDIQIRREEAQLEADTRVAEMKRSVDVAAEKAKTELEKLKLAENSRQRDLDRQQEWDLKIMELNAHTKLEAAKAGLAMEEMDGKANLPVTSADVALKGLMSVVNELKQMQVDRDQPAALEGLKAMIEELRLLHSAPKRIVRDETGRAIGVETMDTRQ